MAVGSVHAKTGFAGALQAASAMGVRRMADEFYEGLRLRAAHEQLARLATFRWKVIWRVAVPDLQPHAAATTRGKHDSDSRGRGRRHGSRRQLT